MRSALALKFERRRAFKCYFFRKRLTLATARARYGKTRKASDALPAVDTKREADRAAASAFSLTIRRYSPGEQSFWIISRVRRAIVSQDAAIKSLIHCSRQALATLATLHHRHFR